MSDFISETEYGECRSAIGNFDKILTDLRLKGISLILAFNGVSALTSQIHVSWTICGVSLTLPVFIQVVVIALTVSIFFLDRIYTHMLLSVVDRAKAVEQVYSRDLDFSKSNGKDQKTKPLTIGISETYKMKFKSIARGHWVIYFILFLVSVWLIVFYIKADKVASG